MENDEIKRPKTHEVGMVLDTLSADELAARIHLLEAEIGRLRSAIEDRHKTRKAAESVFRF